MDARGDDCPRLRIGREEFGDVEVGVSNLWGMPFERACQPVRQWEVRWVLRLDRHGVEVAGCREPLAASDEVRGRGEVRTARSAPEARDDYQIVLRIP